jgi:hypothetical protein
VTLTPEEEIEFQTLAVDAYETGMRQINAYALVQKKGFKSYMNSRGITPSKLLRIGRNKVILNIYTKRCGHSNCDRWFTATYF